MKTAETVPHSNRGEKKTSPMLAIRLYINYCGNGLWAKKEACNRDDGDNNVEMLHTIK